MGKRRRKKRKFIEHNQQRPHTKPQLLPVQAPVIKLTDILIGGFAAANVKAGETLPVIVRASITSDEREFYQYMEGVGNFISKRAKDAGAIISFDSLLGFLLVVHKDATAELYLDNSGMSIEILAKRSIKAGEAVYGKDIADIRRVKYQSLKLETSDKIFSCFKVGWKFGLFFDLADNRELDINQMECDMGALYRRLRYQSLYEALAEKATLERMTKAGWFPFIETMGGNFDPLLKAYQTDFDIDAKEKALVESFNVDRIDLIAERWWRKPVIAENQTVLQAGLDAFKRGDYVSCIKNISSEIEGVLADLHLAEKGSFSRTDELLQHAIYKGVSKSGGEASLFFPNDFLEYLRKVAYANFDKNAPEDAGASRHTVVHGRASGDLYTAARALQAILTLDQIAFYL